MNRFFATSALCVALSATLVAGSASAQTTDPGVTPAPLAPQVEAAPPPAPAVAATGEWVETANGMVWVPAGTQAVAIANTPYAYLYTPTYGWTWYASPWGAGPYVRGAWISHPWPYGFHAWVNRGGSWGWYHAGRAPYHVGHVGGAGRVIGHGNVGHAGGGRGGSSHGGGFHGNRGGGGFHGGGHGGGGHGGGRR